MLEEFHRRSVEVDGVRINTLTGGSGPPLLLLHGYPQTHLIWHRVAPLLARHFTVVLTDLRGYGDSSKPASDDSHAPYSKRVMARDQVGVMASLGFPRFALVGHDRGGRVAHRLALDHPERVTRLVTLDIAPTLAMYEATTMRFAEAYYHWFFLIQPAGVPERMIGADPDWYYRAAMGRGRAGLAPFAPEALAEYLRCMRDPAAIHAACEDYRASAGIDLDHDRGDLDTRLRCPLLVLWGEHGAVAQCFDVMALWRERATRLEGRALPCGHYLAEEKPGETAEAILAFLTADDAASGT